MENEQAIIAAMRRWVETFVVDMNLCHFAKRELVKDRVRFTITDETAESELLHVLRAELELLEKDPSIETTLLIHPQILQEFFDYSLFLDQADLLLVQMRLDSIYQIASFHPDYHFEGSSEDDVENYTNRAPYPCLHLLREASLERAIEAYPDVDEIPTRNIEHMNSLGIDKIKAMQQACFDPSKE